MKQHYLPLFLLAGAMTACQQPSSQQRLAQTLLNDSTLHQVDSLARSVLSSGFNAGSGYSQVWARDLNTFIETACEVNDPASIRGAILVFFRLQQPNDEMVDGYVLKPDFTWYDETPYYSDNAPDHVGFKNTVETDQETSLIQLVGKYVRKTGDRSILNEDIAGRTVLQRMDAMVDYLLRERWSEKYGLLWGAMTADWGDVQPGEGFPCDLNEHSFRSIDVYDNAMLIIALRELEGMSREEALTTKYKQLRESVTTNVRKHLWDEERQKFIPHLYLVIIKK